MYGRRVAGGAGCDVVTGTDEFTAPTGKRIESIVVREDDTRITSIKVGSTETTDKTWQAASTLKANDFIVPDVPINQLTLSSGSVMVYYVANKE